MIGNKGGGRRTPRQAKIIRGTFRKDRNPQREPEPEKIQIAPKAPKYLAKYGRELWKRLAEETVRCGILSIIDIASLDLLCSAYQDFREAYSAIHGTGKRMKGLGQYLAGRNSQTMPEYNALKSSYATYKALAVEFGLTPASRNRIELEPLKKPDEDPMEGLLGE